MADKEVHSLTALAAMDDTDLMIAVDDVAGTPDSRKITFANVKSSILSTAGTGSDLEFVTGTAGTDQNLIEWDANGDAIDSGIAAGDVVTPSSTDTFTNKTFDADGTGNSITNLATADVATAAKSGTDTTFVTGTKGTSGQMAYWDANGDLVAKAVDQANFDRNLGLQTIWMPAVAMTSRATSGAAAGSYDSGAADISIATFDFDTTAQEFVHFQIAMPESWNEGTITFIPYWTNTAGLTTETVEWKLQAYAVSNDDALNATFSNSVTSGDTWIAQNDLHVGPASGALTIDGTPAAGDAVLFELSRNVAGTDNMTGDALLIGVKILYTVNAGTDD